jgi:hypothetical protein
MLEREFSCLLNKSRLVGVLGGRSSQETHYVYATETNRLIPFRETVAISCENRERKRERKLGLVVVVRDTLKEKRIRKLEGGVRDTTDL